MKLKCEDEDVVSDIEKKSRAKFKWFYDMVGVKSKFDDDDDPDYLESVKDKSEDSNEKANNNGKY